MVKAGDARLGSSLSRYLARRGCYVGELGHVRGRGGRTVKTMIESVKERRDAH